MSNYQTIDQTGNGYCGPLVLAAIMGCTSAEAAARVRRVRGLKVVKGTHMADLWQTLSAHGFRITAEKPNLRYVVDRRPGKPSTPLTNYTVEVRRPGFSGLTTCFGGDGYPWEAQYTPVKQVGPTLAEWMRAKRDPNAHYILEVTNHWVLVKGRKFVDTFTKGEWVFLRSAPHRRKRVRGIWRVEK